MNCRVQDWVGNFSVAEHLVASQEGPCILEFVSVSDNEQMPNYVNMKFHWSISGPNVSVKRYLTFLYTSLGTQIKTLSTSSSIHWHEMQSFVPRFKTMTIEKLICFS
jgi:hypothetical protein